MRSLILLALGLMSVVGGGSADRYLHRGVAASTDEIRLQPAGREQGTNIDLRRFPSEDLPAVLKVVADGKLTYIRQTFAWSEIEASQGAFEWARYDAIVTAAAQANVEIVATLSDTPTWARAVEDVSALDAPPRSTAAFQSFCAAIRSRYPGLHYFQIGPALDDPTRWGGRDPSPDEYAALLTVASDALRVGATDSFLIAGDISSTAESRASGADLEAVRAVLGNGRVEQLIDVVALVADGASASPYDRQLGSGVDNLSRTILVREALVDAGYGERAVWLVRLGWSGIGASPAATERQAELVAAGLRRIRSEWAWVDLILAWEFVASPATSATSLALVQGTTPTATYTAYADFAASPFGRSATSGPNAADTPACVFTGNWPEQHLSRRLARVSRDPGAVATCAFWGSGLQVVSRYSPSSGAALFQIDGETVSGWAVESGWSVLPLEYGGDIPVDAAILLAANLDDGPHTLTLRLAEEGELVFSGIVVRDSRSIVWPIALLLITGVLALTLCLREIVTIIAEHLGILQRRRGVVLLPSLPRLTSWQPAARLRGQR